MIVATNPTLQESRLQNSRLFSCTNELSFVNLGYKTNKMTKKEFYAKYLDYIPDDK
jgi:hypothetical protein